MCLNLVRVCVHILLKICDCISVSVCIKGGTKNIGFIFRTPFNERFLSSDFLRRRVMNLQNVKLSLQVCSLSVVFQKIRMDDLFVHPNFYGPGATDLQLKILLLVMMWPQGFFHHLTFKWPSKCDIFRHWWGLKDVRGWDKCTVTQHGQFIDQKILSRSAKLYLRVNDV